MKTDRYTKAVLTVIALLLAVIACSQFVNPHMTAEAQGSFAGVQIGPNLSFFDTRTGEVWIYGQYPGVAGKQAPVESKLRITKLGQPLLDEYEAKRESRY
jgi:hypothetical protein